MENDLTSNPQGYMDKLEKEADWDAFLEFFKISFASISATSVNDSVSLAIQAKTVLKYLKNNPQYIKPGKLPKDVLTVAFKDA
jgi:hypothetical protein